MKDKRQIVRAVELATGVTLADLRSKRIGEMTRYARAIFLYLCRQNNITATEAGKHIARTRQTALDILSDANGFIETENRDFTYFLSITSNFLIDDGGY